MWSQVGSRGCDASGAGRTHLDSSLQCLDLDTCTFQQAIVLHVGHLASVAIDTKVVQTLGVFGLLDVSASLFAT